jgi:lipid II:glycine glycyltransferase (peptidoglycan interpeptide bridge formation enzyme)
MMRNGMRLKKSYHHIQPMRTTVVDLAQNEDALLDKLHHKHRYNINLAERKGVVVEESRDVGSFWRLLQATAEHDKFRAHPMLYYNKLLNSFSPDRRSPLVARLWFAYYGGAPVAGVLMMEHGTTAHYLHGASDREHRALMAPHLLHWDLIRHYKERGFAAYDFWGVDAAKWPGVTRFKLGFGGALVEYPGSFDLVFRRFWRWLYNNAPR